MAIFWNHIKGTNEHGRYSWIKWEDMNPTLYSSATNSFDNATSVGTIITTGLDWSLYHNWEWVHQVIQNEQTEKLGYWKFNSQAPGNYLTVETLNPLLKTQGSFLLRLLPESQQDPISFSVQTFNNAQVYDLLTITTKYADQDISLDNKDYYSLSVNTTTTFAENVTINKDLYGSMNGIFTGFCRAQYFSATSDRRAKENITPVCLSALDFINSITVYNFNYKNNSNPTVGIMAQDVLNTGWEDILVENKNATGLNNDFMAIKEDKLIFVLMKGLQEQQEQIIQLQAELDSLKRGINYGE